jgi:hypothetical protein
MNSPLPLSASRKSGSFAKIAHRAISLRSALQRGVNPAINKVGIAAGNPMFFHPQLPKGAIFCLALLFLKFNKHPATSNNLKSALI